MSLASVRRARPRRPRRFAPRRNDHAVGLNASVVMPGKMMDDLLDAELAAWLDGADFADDDLGPAAFEGGPDRLGVDTRMLDEEHQVIVVSDRSGHGHVGPARV